MEVDGDSSDKSSIPIVQFSGNKVIISSDFRYKQEETKGNIIILNRDTGEVLRTISHHHGEIMDDSNVEDEVNQSLNPIPIWDYFGTNIHKNSICYDQRYDRIYIPDFLCNIDVLDSLNCKFVSKI
mmetsp:Transcript_34769/g.40252  ORF Transcript_34769/g.40252 Transcript_34769/m.40252 type:complete len:126 (+) Transcript_34769:251-628(+)